MSTNTGKQGQHWRETEALFWAFLFPFTRLSIQSEYRRFSQQRTPSNCTGTDRVVKDGSLAGHRCTIPSASIFQVEKQRSSAKRPKQISCLVLDSVVVQRAFPDCDWAILLRMVAQQLQPLVGLVLTQCVHSLKFSHVLILDSANERQEGRCDTVWHRQLRRYWKPGCAWSQPRKVKQAY